MALPDSRWLGTHSAVLTSVWLHFPGYGLGLLAPIPELESKTRFCGARRHPKAAPTAASCKLFNPANRRRQSKALA